MDSDGTYWIRKTREKTDNICDLSLLDFLLDIIRRYENHRMCKSKGILFPVMCNPKMNSYLKEIADFCGIEKEITTHIVRHTYANQVCISQDVPIGILCKMMGHRSVQTTQIYAKITNQKVNEDMKILSNRIENRYELPKDDVPKDFGKNQYYK